MPMRADARACRAFSFLKQIAHRMWFSVQEPSYHDQRGLPLERKIVQALLAGGFRHLMARHVVLQSFEEQVWQCCHMPPMPLVSPPRNHRNMNFLFISISSLEGSFQQASHGPPHGLQSDWGLENRRGHLHPICVTSYPYQPVSKQLGLLASMSRAVSCHRKSTALAA